MLLDMIFFCPLWTPFSERDKLSTKTVKSKDKINAKVAKKIISNYSYLTAFIGGASALTGVIPGLGTVIASFGGATADAALDHEIPN